MLGLIAKSGGKVPPPESPPNCKTFLAALKAQLSLIASTGSVRHALRVASKTRHHSLSVGVLRGTHLVTNLIGVALNTTPLSLGRMVLPSSMYGITPVGNVSLRDLTQPLITAEVQRPLINQWVRAYQLRC